MRFALVNPNWTFEGSTYFGCRDPHLPLEFGYAAALLKRAGHEALIIDGHLFDLSPSDIAARLEDFGPDFVIVTTAPNYLFWRCPPPELRVPVELASEIRRFGLMVAVGPHGSITPGAVLKKLGADVVVMGEFEELLPRLADPNWRDIPALCYAAADGTRLQGKPWTSSFFDLPPLSWPDEWVHRSRHHHHRFDSQPQGSGAVVEGSRGCPYRCTFCSKESFRGLYRKRPLPILLREIDGLLFQGVEYIYFIDEIFLPDETLLSALSSRQLKFGIQTRIDLWPAHLLEALGKAGCVSIEAGVESLSAEGRKALGKDGRLSTEEISERLTIARRNIPFVQANLLRVPEDDPLEVETWRRRLMEKGVWANDPVPLFPYPGSPAYRHHWGDPDERAWERAHGFYLSQFQSLCDLQTKEPLSLSQLESAGCAHG